MLSKELEFTRKPDGGLADQIEVLEAMAEGDAENTELLMLLIELRSLREQLAEKEERLCRLRTSLEIEMKGHEAAERQLAELKALEPVGYVGNCDLYALSAGDLGCISPYNAFEGIPLFTAAKPS